MGTATRAHDRVPQKLQWIGAKGCRRPLSWGTYCAAALLGAALLYVCGGVLVGGVLQKRRGGGVLALHAHTERWHEAYGLLLDGLRFAFGGGRLRGRGAGCGAPGSEQIVPNLPVLHVQQGMRESRYPG